MKIFGYNLFSKPSTRVLDAEYEVIEVATPRGRVIALLCGLPITYRTIFYGVLMTVYAICACIISANYTPPVKAIDTTPSATPIPVVLVSEEPLPPSPAPQDNELLMAIAIDAVMSSVPGSEACSDVTLMMIGNVITNRLQDSRYPDTIIEVLTQPQQFSCFSSSGVKWVGNAIHDPVFKERCLSAAKRVLAGERIFSDFGVVYVSSTKQGIIAAQLDGLYFCR